MARVLTAPPPTGVSGRRVGRPKRVRTIFTTEQLDSMEKAFTMQQYMVGKQRCHLAKTLNLHENQVCFTGGPGLSMV